jgi:hypothetical protein
MRVALADGMTSLILLFFGVIRSAAGAQSYSQFDALSECAETAKTTKGFRIELDPKELRAGKSFELDAIGRVLNRYPGDRVSVQVYEESDPIRDAEKIRDRLITSGVEPGQISLSGLSQPESSEQVASQAASPPTSMWLEIHPES